MNDKMFTKWQDAGDGCSVCVVEDTYSGMAALREELDKAYGDSFEGPEFMRMEIVNRNGQVVMADPYMLFSFISWRAFNPIWEKMVMFRDGAPYAYQFGNKGWNTFDGSKFKSPCGSMPLPAMKKNLYSMMPFSWANHIGEIDDCITPEDMSRMVGEAPSMAVDPDPLVRMDAFWLSYFGRDEGLTRGFVYDADDNARILACSMLLFLMDGIPEIACEDPNPVVRSYCLFSSSQYRVFRFLDDPDENVQMYVMHSNGALPDHFMYLAEKSRFEDVRTAARMRLAALDR